MAINPQDLGRFYKTQNWHFEKCLEPTMMCQGKAIRAHSIQNARVFDLIAANGHVISPRLRLIYETPRIVFKSIGRHEASTFTGLCSAHDNILFAPLDKKALDTGNPEQLFLLSYRSITRELHAVMEAACKIQSAYLSRVRRGIDPPNEESPAGLRAVGHMVNAYETHQYRTKYFDSALIAREFDRINHDVIFLRDQRPCIAVSSLFSFDDLWNGEDVVRVILNAVPLDANCTVAVFSYARVDTRQARIALERVLTSHGSYQKYELSKLIIERVENFAMSPTHFESWSSDKVSRIEGECAHTILNDRVTSEHPDLMMF